MSSLGRVTVARVAREAPSKCDLSLKKLDAWSWAAVFTLQQKDLGMIIRQCCLAVQLRSSSSSPVRMNGLHKSLKVCSDVSAPPRHSVVQPAASIQKHGLVACCRVL
eukprot:6484590-Amphidinium_carterae.1